MTFVSPKHQTALAVIASQQNLHNSVGCGRMQKVTGGERRICTMLPENVLKSTTSSGSSTRQNYWRGVQAGENGVKGYSPMGVNKESAVVVCMMWAKCHAETR